MEKLYYNLSEEEFSKGRKILLWSFVVFFLLGGIYVLVSSLILNNEKLPAILSVAPFSISLIVAVIAFFATMKRKNLFFLVNDEKIEFRYGLLKPEMKTFNWADIDHLVMPHKQKKAQLNLVDGSSYVINLTWLQRKKSSHIRKHIYHAAWEKKLKVLKVQTLKD